MILIRYGELTTKSNTTRTRFLRTLWRNIEDALKREGIPDGRVTKDWSRSFIETEWEEKAIEILKRVFGISSLSKVIPYEFSTVEDIVYKAEEIFAGVVRDKNFAVRVKRTGEHSFRSFDVEGKVGARLKKYGKVDLSSPDVTVNIEIRNSRAYFFTDKIKSAGGLPLGIEGEAVALISGGFDSAVAAFYTLRRGVKLNYVFLNLGGCAHLEGVLKVAKILCDRWSYGTSPLLVSVDFQDVLEDIQRNIRMKYWNIVLKRQMYRIAEKFARETGAEAIVTGESIGQVSSQTLRNLRVASSVAELPILRPLLGLDKEDIIEISKRIGTYNISCDIKEYCSIVQRHPAVRAREDYVEDEERHLDMKLLDAVYDRKEIFYLRKTLDIKSRSPLETEEMITGAVLIDIRSKEQYELWHPEGAVWISPEGIKDVVKDKTKLYIIYCEYGVKSLETARRLKDEGFDALSFKGGVEKLRKIYTRR